MKIEAAKNISFKAQLKGDVKKVISISKKAGLSEHGVKTLLKEMQILLPDKQDKAYFYFRKNQLDPEFYSAPTNVRSGIKLVKGSKVSELNINPQNFQPRDLLQEMVMGFKKLVKGQIKSDDKTVFYDTQKPRSWISFYQEPQQALPDWLKSYNNSFKRQ